MSLPGSAPREAAAARAALRNLRLAARTFGVDGNDAIERAWVLARTSPLSLVLACDQVEAEIVADWCERLP